MADGKTGMCAKEGNQGMFLISYFIFILVEEDGIWLGRGRGSLLRDDSVHWREETCVLLCLDVSSVFFMKLLAVIAR